MAMEDDTIKHLTELSRALEAKAGATYNPDTHLLRGPEHREYIDLQREIAAIDQAILRRSLELAQGASEQLQALSKSEVLENIFWMAAAHDRAVLTGGRDDDDPVESRGLDPIQEAHVKAQRYARGRRGAAPELLDEATDLLLEHDVDLSPTWNWEGTWYADHADPIVRGQQQARRRHPQGP